MTNGAPIRLKASGEFSIRRGLAIVLLFTYFYRAFCSIRIFTARHFYLGLHTQPSTTP